MKLKVLGSGSSGNCYILESQNETLIIEAGLPIKEILKGLNYNLYNVAGCLVSHYHGDHFKSAPELAKRFVPIYSNKYVIDKLGYGYILEEKQSYFIGDFIVFPLTVKHDVECYAYVIIHPNIGKLVFCTDAASFPYHVSGVNHLLIEANYDEPIQEDYILKYFDSHNNIDRLTNSHLSLNQAKEIVKRHNTDNLKTIMLLHLSSRNSEDTYFKEEIQKATGKPVTIANRGLEIEL